MTPAALTDENPLLRASGLPPFDLIRPEHVVPAVRQRLAEAEARFAEVEANVQPTWAATIEALDEIGRPFEYAWGPVTHLFGVRNSPELREAYETVLPEMVAYGLKVRQSKPIYEALKALRDDPAGSLDEAQRRIIDRRVLDAELAGIGLPDDQRQAFNKIAEELSQLGTTFSNNVLDATKAWSLTLDDPHDVEGMPPSLLRLAAASYNAHRSSERDRESSDPSLDSGLSTLDSPATAEAGPWRFTLDAPSYGPFMEHCRRRDLRETMYLAFVRRASEAPTDNTEVLRRILELRQQQAKLLGFETFAEKSLATKMAPSVEAVFDMLDRLRSAAWPHAEREMVELCEAAAQQNVHDPLMHWDVPFWAERLREQRFDFTDEQLRPYFAFDRVLDGLFALCHRLFGITVRRVGYAHQGQAGAFPPAGPDDQTTRHQPPDHQTPVSTWHPDVRFYDVHDESGTHIASFYLDPYSRPENKRGGAWMDDCFGRRVTTEGVRIPVAHLVCNQTPPAGGKPSLMSFREVETLFHEFGHGLQHMLTRVDYEDAAGISNVEWDAVELPSQFMENWCYHRPTLLGMTAHYETGEPLPEDLFEKIVAARTFRSGSMMLRQLRFGLTDLRLHTDYDPAGPESPFDVMRQVNELTGVMPMHSDDRSLCSFQHIFSGGYAAGYYSYKWAEVLAADAFSAFEDAGLDDDAAVRRVGRRFRDTVLALGGSRHPLDIFRDFRGRDPSPEPLLRTHGLAGAEGETSEAGEAVA